jgi:ATP-binding cassette subfamily B protein
MKNNRISLKRIAANNLYILGISVKAAPFTAIFLLILNSLHGVIVYFEHVYQIVYIIDAIQFGKPFASVLRFIVIMFAIVSVNMIFQQFMGARVTPKGKEMIYRAMREKLYAKAKGMDIASYDNPEFFNNFVFAMNNVNNRIDAVIDTAANLISGVTMLVVLSGYMMLTNSVSLVFVAVSFALSFLLKTKVNKIDFILNQKLNPILRKRDYINRVFYLADFVKEIRLSRVKERLYEDYAETEKNVYKALKRKTKKIAMIEFLREYLMDSFIFDLIYLLYLMFLTIVQGTISFGALFGLYRSTQRARGTINKFSESIAQLHEHSLYIEKVRVFLAHEQTVLSKPNPKPLNREAIPGIPLLDMRGVSFTYINASEPTLTDVNLTVYPGEKIAIVGYNGAGKTTLVKLLMRLYDPISGQIRYNGEDICDYDVNEYRDLFATLFQDYQIYAATVAQNVLACNGVPDERRLARTLEQSGFAERLAQMPEGINNQLTKEFTEGEELSGGEKQKLVTSRSLYKNSPIIILDEPSSALDPVAEFELNNTILRLGRDKTVIFISHRLSTTKMADKIYMFEEGRLIENGSHEALLSLNGKYAEMYKLQAEKYR